MALFESLLTLLIIAALLLQLSRRLGAPYPAMLALAGGGVAVFPWAPHLEIQPRLALTLFIAPVLLDAAYDTAPRIATLLDPTSFVGHRRCYSNNRSGGLGRLGHSRSATCRCDCLGRN